MSSREVGKLHHFVHHLWYGGSRLAFVLLPLSWLYGIVVRLMRRWVSETLYVSPIIVIGNLTVGGTGKTPVVMHMVRLLQADGIKPGIVSRGYGGHIAKYPHIVEPDDTAEQVGDEVKLLYEKTDCPIVISPNRRKAVHKMLAHYKVDVILSDDGLQHFQMPRQMEIIIIDGKRMFGNGFLLPAGPLREPTQRLTDAWFVLINGGRQRNFRLAPKMVVNMQSGEERPFNCFAGHKIHACAGIGNAQSFFEILHTTGALVQTHEFPDHHSYTREDLVFGDDRPIVMTEKDEIKCRAFATGNMWVLQTDMHMHPSIEATLVSATRNAINNNTYEYQRLA